MNYPEATGITSRSPRTSQALDKVLSWTLILFALFCSFSISLTQLAAFSGLGILLIRTGLNQSWRQLNWTLMGPVSGLLMAGVLSAVSGVNPEYRLLIFKKVALLLIFFWVVNAFRYFDLKFLQRFIERLTKSDNHSDSKSASSNAGNTHFYLIVAIYLLIAAVTVAALYGFAQAFQHGVSPETRNFIRGNFSHVFTFSALLMMGGLLTFAAVLFGPHKNNLWLWAAALIISTCLLITFTRLTWLGFFFGMVFLLFFKKRTLVLIPPLIVLLLFILGPEGVSQRLTNMLHFGEGSVHLRLLMWSASLEVIKDYPLTGCGYNGLYVIHDQYPQLPILQKYFFNLHSNIFQITVDMGLIGLGAWLFLWVKYFMELFKLCKNIPRSSSSYWVGLASAAVVISFLLGGFFETNFYDSEVVMVLVFIMGLPFVSSATSQTDSMRSSPASKI